MSSPETLTPIQENPDSPMDTQPVEIDPRGPGLEIGLDDTEGRSERLRELASSIAGKIVTPREVLLEDAATFKAAGSESLALKFPSDTSPQSNLTEDSPSPQTKTSKSFDSTYAEDLNSINDIVNIDDRGAAHRYKKTPTSKGDGRFLSRDEVGLIAEHQDQIRNDVQQSPEPTPPHRAETPPSEPVKTPRKIRPGEWKPPQPGTTEYDPEVLELHRKRHMTLRPVVGFGPNPSSPESKPVILSESTIANGERTELQHQAEVRANVRIDAINKREHEIGRYVEMYGDIIRPGSREIEIRTGEEIGPDDKIKVTTERRVVCSVEDIPEDVTIEEVRTLKDILKEGRFTVAQRWSIQKAARKTRRAQKSIDKLFERLNNSADGTDIPGTLVSSRIAAHDAATKGLEKLFQKLNISPEEEEYLEEVE